MGTGDVPRSFFSCIMELLARSLWWTEFLWGWCSPWSSSKSLSSMADEAFWSIASVVMSNDGCVQWVGEGGGVGERRGGEIWKRWKRAAQGQFILAPDH